MDQNYWKKAYKDTWEASSKREEGMVQWIKDNTDFEAEIIGLGAGTTEFIKGSAAENGYEKGDADLHVKKTNVYIEITGPLTSSVSTSDPLWFRPDKFENAIKKTESGHDTFFAHHCPSEDLWRIIHIDDALIKRYKNGEFHIVNPVIRGRKETYVEVLADDKCIQPLKFLKQYLKKK